MRLSRIGEAFGDVSRRSFVKGAVGAVSGGPLGLLRGVLGRGADKYVGAIRAYEGLGERARSAVDDFTHELDLYGMGLGGAVGGVVEYEGVRFPLVAVIGSNFSNADSLEDMVSLWLTGDDPKIWDRIIPGALGDAIDIGIKRGGVEGFVGAVREVGEDYGPDFVFGVWKAALSNERLRDALGVTGEMVSRAEIDPRALAVLVKKGMVSRGYAAAYVEMSDPRARELKRKREKREKGERDRRARREAGEEFEVPRDYGVAAPMHQYFEGRLRLVLGVL